MDARPENLRPEIPRPGILRALREQLQVAGGGVSTRPAVVRTKLAVLDEFASDAGGFASGAIHEILAGQEESADAFAALLASSAATAKSGGWIVWSDPERTLYPPALKTAGVDLDRLLLLRPRSPQDELWALAECMRCPGVAATVAHVGRLTSVQARRLQLAAEQGGGVGVLVRPDDKRSANYAAATRWRVSSIAATRAAQRWQVELAYGHGGRVGQSFVLEVDRDTGRAAATAVSDREIAEIREAKNSVHRTADLAHRSRPTASRRSSA